MAGSEAEPSNVFEKRNQQITNSRDKPLQFLIKWILPKIVVQVSDQMNQAFLLPTRERIVSSIKVCHNRALEGGKQWLQKLCSAIWPQFESHPSIVGKHPNVLVCPQDVYPCLIKLHHWPIQKCVQQQIVGALIVLRKFLNKTRCRLWSQRL
jgi:hypothetical protein